MQHRLCAAPTITLSFSLLHAAFASTAARATQRRRHALRLAASSCLLLAASPPHANQPQQNTPSHAVHRYLKATTQKPLPNSRCPTANTYHSHGPRQGLHRRPAATSPTFSPFYSVPPTYALPRNSTSIISPTAPQQCLNRMPLLSIPPVPQPVPLCDFFCAIALPSPVPFLPLSQRSAIFVLPPRYAATPCCGGAKMMRVPSDPIRHIIWNNAHSKHKARSMPLSF